MDLGGLDIAGLLLLIGSLFSETKGENTQVITISSFHVNMSFNESLPLLDQKMEFISSEVHTPEVSEHSFALNIYGP